MKFPKITSCACLALLAFSAVSHADTISGIAWSVPASTVENVPTLGNTPGPNAKEVATFNASALQFSYDQGAGNYTLGGFLNAFGAASNINYMNGASGSTDLTDILFEFTGNAYFTNGQTTNVYHDDGVNLYVDGKSVLSSPASTHPKNSPYTFTGASGLYGFDFIYANSHCCQAEFETNLSLPTTPPPSAVTPEPSSIMLLGTGLLGTAGVLRRRLFQ